MTTTRRVARASREGLRVVTCCAWIACAPSLETRGAGDVRMAKDESTCIRGAWPRARRMHMLLHHTHNHLKRADIITSPSSPAL